MNTSGATLLNVIHLIKKSTNRHTANEFAVQKKLKEEMQGQQAALGELNVTKGLTGGQSKEAGTYHLNKERVVAEVLLRKRKKTMKQIDVMMDCYKKEQAIYTVGVLAMRGNNNGKIRSLDYNALIKFK